MRLDLRSLRAERGARLEAQIAYSVDSRVEGLPFVRPVEGRLVLHNLGAAVRVVGRLRTTVHLVCDRCATSFTQSLASAVEEELPWEEPSEAGDGGSAYLIHAGDAVWLDVDALARDALVLALPMVALCRPDCPGLCPRCGVDLRVEACRCPNDEAEAIDPRLRVLTEWQRAHRPRESA